MNSEFLGFTLKLNIFHLKYLASQWLVEVVLYAAWVFG